MAEWDPHIELAHEFLEGYHDPSNAARIPTRGMLLFYSSIHLVEAMAIAKGQSTGDSENFHTTRRNWVKSAQGDALHAAYCQMETLGRNSRYYPKRGAGLKVTQLEGWFHDKFYTRIVERAARELKDESIKDRFLPTPASS